MDLQLEFEERKEEGYTYITMSVDYEECYKEANGKLSHIQPVSQR